LHKKVAKRNKFSVAVKWIAILLLCLCIFCAICLSRFGRDSESAGTKSVVSGGVVNILITGTDLSAARTDTILLASYNPKNGSLKLLSIPRDTLVTLNGKNSKINAANAYGGESLLVSTVEDLLDIDINFYATINYTGFDRMVDAIGGVNMTIPANMDYDDPTQDLEIHFTKGETVHLNGKKAEEFFRWRENNDGTGIPTGDIGRIDNQHLLIEKIMEKVKSPAGLIRAPYVLHVASKNIETNMKAADIIKYGFKIATVDKTKIDTVTLQGSTPYIGGVSYFVYDKEKNSDLTASLRSASSSAKFDPKKLKVEVLNCTDKSGVAANYASKLKQEGFRDVATGNGTQSATSKVILYGLDSSVKSDIKSMFGISKVETDDSKTGIYDIVVMLGEDYKS
jgi:polyisoprenyl-teichoic acid--peptidoglycan teichoic acid transferase